MKKKVARRLEENLYRAIGELVISDPPSKLLDYHRMWEYFVDTDNEDSFILWYMVYRNYPLALDVQYDDEGKVVSIRRTLTRTVTL